MLAYMDNILELADAKDIKSKISESEYASKLVDRIRDASKSTAIGAPAISGTQMGLDPNRVAEYLDNVVPLDQVEEFEKNCLQSDAYLAELASSHKVLTLILGEPAAVDPKLREQMYTLIDKAQTSTPEEKAAASAPVSTGSGIGKAAAATNGAAKLGDKSVLPEKSSPKKPSDSEIRRREKPAVPEYLKEEPGNRWLMPAAAVLLIVVLGTVIYTVGTGPNVDLAKGTPVEPVEKDPNNTDPAKVEPANTDPAKTDPAKVEPVVTDPVKVDPEKTDPTKVDPTKVEPVKVDPEKTDPTKTEPPTKVELPTKVETPTKIDLPTKVEPPTKVDPGKVEPPTKVEATKVEPGKVEPGKVEPPVKTDPEKADPTKTIPPRPAVAKSEMGQYTTADSILLTFNSDRGDWQRLRPQSVVVSGSRLISLPTFRSTIALNDGLLIDLVGGTIAELEPAGADGVPRVRVYTGQLVATAAKPGLKLVVLFGDTAVVTNFVGPQETAVGFDVRARRAAGIDPESLTDAPVRYDATYWVATGQVTFDNGATNLAVDKPPSQGSLVPLKELGVEEAPWIKGHPISLLDTQAKRIVEPIIQPGMLVTVPLKELAEHRKAEVSLLAMRSLIFVGEFEPVLKAINSVDLRAPSRNAIVNQMFEAVQWGPEPAKQLHATLKTMHGEKADGLWRMFWGYTKEQLDRGEAARLVEYLDHDELDYRVLAFANLESITGVNLLYRPEVERGSQRSQAVGRWQQKLEAKQIVPKQ